MFAKSTSIKLTIVMSTCVQPTVVKQICNKPAFVKSTSIKLIGVKSIVSKPTDIKSMCVLLYSAQVCTVHFHPVPAARTLLEAYYRA